MWQQVIFFLPVSDSTGMEITLHNWRATREELQVEKLQDTRVMDNADLETLKLAPGRLNPRFAPGTTDYTVLLSSAAALVRVECLTSDSGASYVLLGVAPGERSVALSEGLNNVIVEVRVKYTYYVREIHGNDTNTKFLVSLLLRLLYYINYFLY